MAYRYQFREVVFVVVIALILSWYSSAIHSPVLHEPAQYYAGLQYLSHGSSEHYVVNPPLIKAIAALPSYLLGVRAASYTREFDRDEFWLARRLLKDQPEESLYGIFLGRIICSIFLAIGALVCFFWASTLYSRPSGLFACCLWCSLPDVIGHSSTLLSDLPAASMFLFAAYCLSRVNDLAHPQRLLMAASICSLAAATKFTCLLLYPPAIIYLAYLSIVQSGYQRKAIRDFAIATFLFMSFSVFIINALYLFQDTFAPLSSFQFRSKCLHSLFSYPEIAAYFGNVPIPLPRDLVVGLDLQKRDFEDRIAGFVAGAERSTGVWWFYLFGMLIKLPLGLILMIPLTLYSSWSMRKQSPPSKRGVSPILWFFVVLVTISFNSTILSHYRYCLPSIGFLVVWVSQSASIVLNSSLRSIAYILLAISVTSSLSQYPHSLSFYNCLIGGPSRGHHYLRGSALDWGQDLYLLGSWLKCHKEVESLTLIYDHWFDLDILRMQNVRIISRVSPANNFDGLHCGWYAIGVNNLFSTPDASPNHFLVEYLKTQVPIHQIGRSIYVYYLDQTVFGDSNSDNSGDLKSFSPPDFQRLRSQQTTGKSLRLRALDDPLSWRRYVIK